MKCKQKELPAGKSTGESSVYCLLQEAQGDFCFLTRAPHWPVPDISMNKDNWGGRHGVVSPCSHFREEEAVSSKEDTSLCPQL